MVLAKKAVFTFLIIGPAMGIFKSTVSKRFLPVFVRKPWYAAPVIPTAKKMARYQNVFKKSANAMTILVVAGRGTWRSSNVAARLGTTSMSIKIPMPNMAAIITAG